MSFDELYDEMLSLEFSSRGRHAKAEDPADPAGAVAAVMAGEVAVHARHAKADALDMVDGSSEPATADGEHERPSGLARYRTAALVGAGGLACATVGAFLGGLGGYFTVSPAGAHAVASTTADGPAGPAVHRSAHSSDSTVTPPLPGTAFTPVSGGLTQAGSGVGSITATPSPNSPLPGLPVRSGPIAGGSSGSGSGSGGSGGGGSTGSTGAGTTTQPTQPASPTPCQSVCVGVPSLPVPVPTVPTLPVPTPTSPLPLPVSVQTTPSTGTSTSVTAPLPVPTPPTSTTLGPVSEVTSSGSGSTSGGATLNLG
jgi:hypothetical protein